MDKKQISQDILNMIERLRIMYELAKDQNFSTISKEELKSDLKETLDKLEKDFTTLDATPCLPHRTQNPGSPPIPNLPWLSRR